MTSGKRGVTPTGQSLSWFTAEPQGPRKSSLWNCSTWLASPVLWIKLRDFENGNLSEVQSFYEDFRTSTCPILVAGNFLRGCRHEQHLQRRHRRDLHRLWQAFASKDEAIAYKIRKIAKPLRTT